MADERAAMAEDQETPGSAADTNNAGNAGDSTTPPSGTANNGQGNGGQETPELVPLIKDPEEEANEASDVSQSDSLQKQVSSASRHALDSGSVTNLRSNSR